MRLERRAMWCLMLQVSVTICMLTLQGMQRGSLAVPAMAEAELQVERIIDASPAPAPAAMPEDAAAAVLQVEVIRATETPAVRGRILIYHTHTWEAYEQVPGNLYRQTEKWRTRDNAHNVVAVGDALTASLRSLGFEVVHDVTPFEPPVLDTAYDRSLKMLEERAAAGERYDLYIDLHRDALASNTSVKKTVMLPDGEAARFMVLVGKGTTGGYEVRPDWEANLALAERITMALNAQCDGLARDVKVKTGRFNQHIAPCCVLIECGMNSNTLDQVLRGVPYLAQALEAALTAELSASQNNQKPPD